MEHEDSNREKTQKYSLSFTHIIAIVLVSLYIIILFIVLYRMLTELRHSQMDENIRAALGGIQLLILLSIIVFVILLSTIVLVYYGTILSTDILYLIFFINISILALSLFISFFIVIYLNNWNTSGDPILAALKTKFQSQIYISSVVLIIIILILSLSTPFSMRRVSGDAH